MARRGSAGKDGPTALVISAGASRRFAGEPKALLPVGDEPAGARIVRNALAAGCAEVIAVLGWEPKRLRKMFEKAGASILENKEWEEGRTGSIQHGLREVDDGSEVLLWPVDHPFAAAESAETLFRMAATDEMGLWFIPVYDGHGGHPVLLRPAVFPRILDLAPGAPLRSLLPSLGVQVTRVAVDDPGVIEAVDTPESYQRFHQRWGERQRG
jgi:molybdenum cofactor cytidylyltransferase